MRTIAAILAAALLGWFAREAAMHDLSPAPVPPLAAVHLEPAAAPPATERVTPYAAPLASHGDRNLFAYREAPAPRVYAIVEEPTPTATPTPVVVAVVPETPPQPRFAYRFIGTFGTRDKRLAAFTRDGEVIAVRAGGKIGSEFVLRSIALESVEVQPLAAPGAAQRVALGQ
jgi:hypothetical protein